MGWSNTLMQRISCFPNPKWRLRHFGHRRGQLQFKQQGVMLHLLEDKYHITYLKFFSPGDLSSPFYICIQSFISVWTHGCLFIFWVIIQYYLINFVAQVFPALAIETSALESFFRDSNVQLRMRTAALSKTLFRIILPWKHWFLLS